MKKRTQLSISIRSAQQEMLQFLNETAERRGTNKSIEMLRYAKRGMLLEHEKSQVYEQALSKKRRGDAGGAMELQYIFLTLNRIYEAGFSFVEKDGRIIIVSE